MFPHRNLLTQGTGLPAHESLKVWGLLLASPPMYTSWSTKTTVIFFILSSSSAWQPSHTCWSIQIYIPITIIPYLWFLCLIIHELDALGLPTLTVNSWICIMEGHDCHFFRFFFRIKRENPLCMCQIHRPIHNFLLGVVLFKPITNACFIWLVQYTWGNVITHDLVL